MSMPTNVSGLPGAGRRLALVAGVNRAPNASLSSLNYAIADAEAMAEALQEHCSFELLALHRARSLPVRGAVTVGVTRFAWIGHGGCSLCFGA